MKNFKKIDDLLKDVCNELRIAQIEIFEAEEARTGVDAQILRQKREALKELEDLIFMKRGAIINYAI